MEQYQVNREDRYQQRVKFDFPRYSKFELWRPLHTIPSLNLSKDGCIVYPLYAAFDGIYPEHHINSACWSAHSFLVNSDVLEQKIPVYFYVEDEIWSRAYKQLMSSCIPNPMVLHYRAPNRIGWKGQWMSQSLCLVNNDRFNGYENVVVPDTDLFLSTRHANKKLDISRLWNRIDRTKYASYDIRPDRMRTPKWISITKSLQKKVKGCSGNLHGNILIKIYKLFIISLPSSIHLAQKTLHRNSKSLLT